MISISNLSRSCLVVGAASLLALVTITPLFTSASPVGLDLINSRTILNTFEERADPPCARYVLIATRGTNEPQAPSPQFYAMSNYTLQNVTGGVAYQTVYPAGADTEQLGANDIVRRVEQGLSTCPNQKYVLLGYSQGATATAIALQNYTNPTSAGYQAIVGVVIVGNPAKLANKISNLDQFGGSRTNSTNGVYWNSRPNIPAIWYGSKLLDFCYQDDLVCVGLNFWSIINAMANHLKYKEASVQNLAAPFLIRSLRAALD